MMTAEVSNRIQQAAQAVGVLIKNRHRGSTYWTLSMTAGVSVECAEMEYYNEDEILTKRNRVVLRDDTVLREIKIEVKVDPFRECCTVLTEDEAIAMAMLYQQREQEARKELATA